MDPLQLQHCVVDLTRRHVHTQTGLTTLTTKEAELLAYLSARPEILVSRDELLVEVWGYAEGVFSRAVDTTMRRLRTKIEANPAKPDHLTTVHGSGYRFVPPLESPVVLPAPVALEPSPSAQPVDLPHNGAQTIGRETQLAKIEERFKAGARLVTILGPGGMGKSQVAIAHLHRVNLAGEASCLYLNASTDVDGETNLEGLATQLGLETSGDVLATTTVLGEALRRQGPTRLLIDDMDGERDLVLAALEPWLVVAPDLSILLTSRSRTNLASEHIFELGPLNTADGSALFIQRAGVIRPSFSPDEDDLQTIESLVETLDGMPLAIALAAGRSRLMSPAQLMIRLSDGFSFLQGTAAGGHARHSGVHAMMASSWADLTEEEQRLLAGCTVFQGGFSLEAIEAVLQPIVSSSSIMDLAQDLADSSWLRVEESDLGLRFRLYSPIRAFLEKENVLGTEFSHVRDAHLGWFLTESTKRGEEIADRADIREMNWLSAERPNLLAAIAHAAAVNLSQWAELMRIVIDSDVARAATLALSTLLDDATEDSEDIPIKARARLLTSRAHALRFTGQIEAARPKIDQALILAVESKDADIECAARYTAAWVYWDINEHQEARAHLDAMEARAPSGDVERWEVRRLFMCCYVEARSGQHTEAKAAGLQAIRLATRREEPRRVAMLHQRLGAISRDMGDMADAINHTRKAAEIYTQIQDRRNMAYTKNALAMLFAVDHRLDEAGPLLDEARETIEKIGEHHAMALMLGNRGAIHLGLDELAEADQCLWESLQIFDATAIPRGRGFYEAYLGATRALAGRIDKAETLVDAAEATLSEAQFAGLEEFMSAMRALVDVGRARVDLKNGHGERAATLLEQAAAQSQPSTSTTGVVGFAHHLLARAIEQT